MLNRPGRRAFSLLELLVVLTLSSVVLTAVSSLVLRQQRSYGAWVESVALRREARLGASTLTFDLRAVAPNDGDLYAIAPTAFELRAATGASVLCDLDSTRTRLMLPPLQLTSRAGLTSWIAAPQAGDSLLIYDVGEAFDRSDDQWRPHTLVADASPRATCPEQSGFTVGATESVSGWSVRVTPPIANTVTIGAPLRFFRRARYALYHSSTDAADLLGYSDCLAPRATPCSAPQPTAGPFEGGSLAEPGMSFIYRDSTGAAVRDARRVARVDLTLRVTGHALWKGGGRRAVNADSLSAIVAPRN